MAVSHSAPTLSARQLSASPSLATRLARKAKRKARDRQRKAMRLYRALESWERYDEPSADDFGSLDVIICKF